MTAEPAARLGRDHRRLVLVDRPFQLKYSAILVGIGLLLMAVSALAVHLLFENFLAGATLSSHLKQELLEGKTDLLRALFVLSVPVALVLAVLGISATHRIAGPAFAMTRHMAVLARGSFPVIRPLREKDELKDLMAVFEDSVGVLRTQATEEMFKLDQALSMLREDASPEEIEAARTILEALRDRKRTATAKAGS